MTMFSPVRIFAALRQRMSARLKPLACDLLHSSDANVVLISAVAIIPAMFGLGFSVDYARAEMLQSRIAAVADAAALAGTDPVYYQLSNTTAQNAATTIFNAEVADYADFTLTYLNVTTPSSTDYSRQLQVTWAGKSANMFSTILGASYLAIGGTSVSADSLPPNLNFYFALDTSPSMLLPTTSTGITNLAGGAFWLGESYYYGQTDGCDFACHATNMQTWNLGVYVIDQNKNAIYLANSGSMPFYRVSCTSTGSTPNAVYDNNNNLLGTYGSITGSETYCTTTARNGPQSNPVSLTYLPTGKTNKTSNYVTVSVNFPDTWWLAENYTSVNPGSAAITLRTDAEATAAAGVIQTAYTYQQQLAAQNTPVTYQMQFFTFNITPGKYGSTTITSPTPLTTSPFGTMTAVSTLQSATFPTLGQQAPQLVCCSYWTSNSITTNNHDSDFGNMLKGMEATLPNPGGTGQTGSTPQSVLVIVTDGLEDTANGSSALTTSDLALCTAIKNASTYNARIAILYTQYDPNTINYTGDTTFNTDATNVVPNISAALQSCSTQNTDGSYLFITVGANGDITAGLNQLFAAVVQNSHLVR